MAISIDTRYWFEDSVARAWPPGADVFTGENNPKANYALDLNIDGKVMTFIPDSVINQGVYSPWSDTRISGKSYYFPWFLDQKNQEKLAEVGQKVDLSDSDVGGYLKDQMGATTSGVLVPKGSIPFDSKIVNSPGKVLGMGGADGKNVYVNENVYNTGDTYFTDSSGQMYSQSPNQDDGGLFGTGIGPNLSWTDFRDALETAAVIGGNYILPGSSLLSSQLVSEGAKKNLSTDLGKAANIGAGIAGSMPSDPNAVGGATGPDNIDVGGGWSPATGATAAELEASRLALESQQPLTAEQITAEIQAGKPVGSAEKNALYSNAGYGDTMTSAQIDAFDKAVASGLSVSDALNYARAGLLINAIAGDPLGLSGTPTGNVGGGSTGFDIVPVPSDWKSPTYTTTPVVNTTFEDLFPGVSLQGTQWQGLQNAQPNMTFNDIFASGLQSTPMGTPVNISDIVGNIIGQSAKS